MSVCLAGLLSAAGLAVASNMGLMLRLELQNPNRDHWVSLPYRSDLQTAQDLCDRIGPAASLVSRFDSAALLRVDWNCPLGDNFQLTAGDAVFVRVSTATQVLLIGSHDPDVAVPPGGFPVAGRDYFISVPYHTSATNASDLCGQIPDASLISRFEPSTRVIEDWTCPFGSNFTLRKGEALRVRVSAPSPGFVPEHF